jgi:hypothetical protein
MRESENCRSEFWSWPAESHWSCDEWFSSRITRKASDVPFGGRERGSAIGYQA